MMICNSMQLFTIFILSVIIYILTVITSLQYLQLLCTKCVTNRGWVTSEVNRTSHVSFKFYSTTNLVIDAASLARNSCSTVFSTAETKSKSNTHCKKTASTKPNKQQNFRIDYGTTIFRKPKWTVANSTKEHIDTWLKTVSCKLTAHLLPENTQEPCNVSNYGDTDVGPMQW